MKKIRYTITLLSVGITLLFCSCDKWLKVEPMDKMDEDKVFSSKEGFVKAINGIYLDMVSNKLYGMSCSFLDVLAQRYFISGGHKFEKLSQYTYTEEAVKGVIDQVWKQTYAEIANCNRMLEHLDKKKEMLGNNTYNLLKGEALGLRAMLHFDILRLWAPSFDAADAKGTYVPYYSQIVITGEPLLSVGDFVERLIADLNNAELALQHDPTRYSLSENRNFRFNYYAVKLMQARVYQFRGTVASRNRAYQIATEVINSAYLDQVFPSVSADMATGSGDYSGDPDRVFYSELIFCLQNTQRKQIYEDWFLPSLNANSILAQVATTVDALYSYTSDYRKVQMWMTVLKDGKDMRTLLKYDEINGNENTLRTVAQSVLRKSEFYLIAADCAPTEATACLYLNMLQKARGYKDANFTKPGDGIDVAIRDEYSREFYGEGQYFFYLKRKNVKSLNKGNGDGVINMTNTEYVLPLPDSEINAR